MTSHMYRIWHWNVAGHSIHKGSTSDGLIEIIANSIVANNADFATLNELCRNQYDELIDELRTRGWPSDDGNFARFATARAAGTNVCQDYAYGIALFSKLPLNSATTIDLVDGNALEHRKMLCAPLAARPHVRLCTTHVTTDSTYQPGQFQTILSKLDGYFAQDDSVILTGDLNVQPGSALLNPFYSAAVDTAVNGNNSGSLRELDDSDPAHCPGYGEQTFGTTGGACDVGRKLDYIFVPEERMNGAGEADSHAIPQCGSIDCSDHRMLEGSVKLYAP